MPILLGFVVLVITLMLQTAIVSTLPILNGYADLVLLVLVAWSLQDRVRSTWIWMLLGGALVGYISALPLFLPLVGYAMVTGITRLLIRRVWQSPILVMFVMTFLGSLLMQGLVMVYLIVQGTSLPFADSLNLIIFPGTLMNLLLALPVYAVIGDLSQLVYPGEVEA